MGIGVKEDNSAAIWFTEFWPLVPRQYFPTKHIPIEKLKVENLAQKFKRVERMPKWHTHRKKWA